jgi:hypothetical protein
MHVVNWPADQQTASGTHNSIAHHITDTVIEIALSTIDVAIIHYEEASFLFLERERNPVGLYFYSETFYTDLDANQSLGKNANFARLQVISLHST